jgi:hypothetical protein
MSKSPRRVLQVAYDAAPQAVAAHRHQLSPKKFTQPQLLACLALKEFLRPDYRGLAEHLADHGERNRLLDLKVIPHYTTSQKAAAGLLKAAPARKLFDVVLDLALRAKVRKRRVPLAAVDGTGMESRHTSRYYVRRRPRTGSETQETTYSKYHKVVLVTDCRSHLVLAATPARTCSSSRRRSRTRPAARRSGRCRAMPTTTRSGCMSVSGRPTASARSSRRSAGGRGRSRRPAGGVAG